MGCDIHMIAQKRENDGTWQTLNIRPFYSGRSYGIYGFLADVRNYSDIPCISKPRGLPGDLDYDEDENDWLGDHSFSWLTVAELTLFDYEQTVEDRRITVQTSPNSWNGGATAEPGGGVTQTYREFLGTWYFEELATIVASGADRVVFGFDS